MAYGASNDHLLDEVTCPVFSILLLICLVEIAEKNSKYDRKNFSLSHC